MTNLKTLLEKLKPEIREAIEADRALYPSSVKHLCHNLSQVFFVSDMRYEDALSVMGYHRAALGEKATTPWDCMAEVPAVWEAE
jgi:hypothetical protein